MKSYILSCTSSIFGITNYLFKTDKKIPFDFDVNYTLPLEEITVEQFNFLKLLSIDFEVCVILIQEIEEKDWQII